MMIKLKTKIDVRQYLIVIFVLCIVLSGTMLVLTDTSMTFMSKSEAEQCYGRCDDYEIELSTDHSPKYESDPSNWTSISFSVAAKEDTDEDHDGNLYVKATGKFTNLGETWEFDNGNVTGEYQLSVADGLAKVGATYKFSDFSAPTSIFGGYTWKKVFDNGWSVSVGTGIYFKSQSFSLSDGEFDAKVLLTLNYKF